MRETTIRLTMTKDNLRRLLFMIFPAALIQKSQRTKAGLEDHSDEMETMRDICEDWRGRAVWGERGDGAIPLTSSELDYLFEEVFPPALDLWDTRESRPFRRRMAGVQNSWMAQAGEQGWQSREQVA